MGRREDWFYFIRCCLEKLQDFVQKIKQSKILAFFKNVFFFFMSLPFRYQQSKFKATFAKMKDYIEFKQKRIKRKFFKFIASFFSNDNRLQRNRFLFICGLCFLNVSLVYYFFVSFKHLSGFFIPVIISKINLVIFYFVSYGCFFLLGLYLLFLILSLNNFFLQQPTYKIYFMVALLFVTFVHVFLALGAIFVIQDVMKQEPTIFSTDILSFCDGNVQFIKYKWTDAELYQEACTWGKPRFHVYFKFINLSDVIAKSQGDINLLHFYLEQAYDALPHWWYLVCFKNGQVMHIHLPYGW